MDGDHRHDPDGNRAEHKTAAVEGIRHGEHARADVRLYDVHNGLQLGRAFAFRFLCWLRDYYDSTTTVAIFTIHVRTCFGLQVIVQFLHRIV